MLKDFFGMPVYRFGDLSQMFFTQKDLAVFLGLDKEILNILLHQLKYSRALGLPRGTKGRPRKEVSNVFTLEVLLGCIFNRKKKTRDLETLVHWVCDALNNLAYDEFVSLYGFRTSLKTRRAIISKVIGIKYAEIPLYRFDNQDKRYWGTIYREQIKRFSPRVRNPDSYISRNEVTKVKALDLVVYLIVKHSQKQEEDVLKFLDINLDDGSYESHHQDAIKEFIDNLA